MTLIFSFYNITWENSVCICFNNSAFDLQLSILSWWLIFIDFHSLNYQHMVYVCKVLLPGCHLNIKIGTALNYPHGHSKYNIMEAVSIRSLFYMRKIIYTAMKGLSPVAAAMEGSLTLSYFNLFFIYSFLSVLFYWCPGNKYLIFLGKPSYFY